jgi:hypothetical protein
MVTQLFVGTQAGAVDPPVTVQVATIIVPTPAEPEFVAGLMLSGS